MLLGSVPSLLLPHPSPPTSFLRLCLPQMLYQRTGPFTFDKVLDLPPRPGAPWSYPQTGARACLPALPALCPLCCLPACRGQPLPPAGIHCCLCVVFSCLAGLGLPLPIASPYKKVVLLAAGGSAEDRADPYTPASDTADLIDVSLHLPGARPGFNVSAWIH